MAFLKFNKPELVNLSYSLKREIISANKTGAYCNTSIVTCNTRRYHGLLAVPIDNFGDDKYLLLSSLDESLVVNGKQFNLGIHCYGDIYEPRGHKYIIDFDAHPVPKVVYKIGETIFTKELLLAEDKDQMLIKYEVLKAPDEIAVRLKPFLAFRGIHALTSRNDEACLDYKKIKNGVSFKMYEGFPDLRLQLNTSKSEFKYLPDWYMGVTYSDEYRRGFDCREDLFVPGWFEVNMKEGESIVISASTEDINPTQNKRRFNSGVKKIRQVKDAKDELYRWADLMVCDRNSRKKITAGFSWLYTGLLRESLITLPGLTLYGDSKKSEFEEILDNLIEDEQVRLFHKTTQVEAPLLVAKDLQEYIEMRGGAKRVWKKYGDVVKKILESYLPGHRDEVAMQPNGLLWAQKDGVALSWMNAYIEGVPVTERPGYQIELNSFWYDAICFALEMEDDPEFVERWTYIKELIEKNFTNTFWDPNYGFLADYVDWNGRHMEVRPNQMTAVCMKHSPISDEIKGAVMKIIASELVTRRGLRTLSPRDAKYRGVYEGTQYERDLAYHQGSTRPFLLNPYVDFNFKAYGPAFLKKAEWLVEGFYEDLSKHGVGAFSEIYDADPPHEAHGAISSALTTAALLKIDYLIKKHKEEDL